MSVSRLVSFFEKEIKYAGIVMKYKSFHPRRRPIRYRVNLYKIGRYEIFDDSDDDVREQIDDVDNVEDEYEEDFF